MAGTTRHERGLGHALIALAATALLLCHTTADAQDGPPTPAAQATSAAAAARAGADADVTAETDRDAKFPLIREGSRLVRVRGLVDRDPRTRTLRLTIDQSDPQSPGHQLVLLPSSRLTELEMVLGAAPTVTAQMVVTGRVFVFDGRNYLLLTHPAVPDERALLAAADETTVPPSSGDADPADDTDDGEVDSVEDIARELEREVGPAGRRTPAMPPADASDTVRQPPAGAADLGRLMPEGTRLVDRRGKVRRTSGGGFVFVFDADTAGTSDPPVMLLPCRLLELLARIAAGSGDEAAVLLSGEVTIHDGRNYLLPSVFRMPREQTSLRP